MTLQSALDLKHHVLTQIIPGACSIPRSQHGRRMTAADGRIALQHTGLAVGITSGKNARGFRLAVRLQQQALLDSPVVEAILREARGEAEALHTGTVRCLRSPLWFRARGRPLEIGVSVAHEDVTAGTLGAFVMRRGSRRLLLLGNNHVLANLNRARRGQPILQPGTFDGGMALDVVARFLACVRISFTRPNLVDAAIARLSQGIDAIPGLVPGIGPVTGVLDGWPEIASPVQKLGRTTGHTHGVVSAIAMDDVLVEMGTGRVAVFNEQVEIQSACAGRPFSQGGDSGSLIIAPSGIAAGLLFSGSDCGGAHNLGVTYANRLDHVLGKLKVSLVTA